MIKRISFLVALSVVTLLVSAQKDIVYFENDSYELTALTKQKLDELAHSVITDKHKDELLITGHTDVDGTDDYNKVLSFNRARAVHDYLSKSGLTNRVRIVSYGETINVNANKNDDEKALNRRVEISREPCRAATYSYGRNDSDTQDFLIHPTRDTMLQGSMGTKVWIDRLSFQGADLNKPITIRIKEYYTKSDFVLANLTTLTEDRKILESKGMIYIEAMQEQEQLNLKPDSEIDILFKDRSANDETEIFSGSEVNDEVVWVLQDKTIRSVKSQYLETPRSLKRYEWQEETNFQLRRRAIRRSGKDGFFIEIDTTARIEKSEDYQNSQSLFGAMVQSSNKLGWINCDRFINSNAPKADVLVEFEGEFLPKICMVFKKINSVLPHSGSWDNQYAFYNLPSGMEVDLIGFYQEKDSDKILFAKRPYIIGEAVKVELQFEEKDMQSIAKELRSL